MAWLSFQEIIDRWGAAEFEVLPAFKEGGLHPYHQGTGEKLIYDENIFAIPRKSEAIGNYPSWFDAILGMRFNTDMQSDHFQIMTRNWQNPDIDWFSSEVKDFNRNLVNFFREHSDIIRWRLKDVEAYEQETGSAAPAQVINSDPGPTLPVVNSGRTLTALECEMVYRNYHEYGMDVAKLVDKMFPDDPAPYATKRQRIHRAIERHKKKLNKKN